MDGIISTAYAQLTGDDWSEVDSGIPEEAPLSIYVNGQELVTFMCTPAGQDALALGFLANEGLINELDEVVVLHVCAAGTCVDVWLSHAVQRPSRPIITSGCGGGVTFDDLTEQIEPLQSEKHVRPAQLQRLMRQLNSAGRLYREVRGIHTSALSDGQRLLLIAEDIGRHNTLDKLRGLALMQGVDTQDMVLLSSGRISSEMLNKAAHMGVPVIVSRTSPTSLSVALAQAWGITLVGYVRQNRMNVYTGVERLQAQQRPEVERRDFLKRHRIMNQQIDRETLDHILQTEDVTTLSFPDLVKLFQDEQGSADYLPDGVGQTDPRNGDRILFNSSRARRPHDNRPKPKRVSQPPQACVVCQGRTTGVVDVAELSEGLTFINKNLYPSLFPSPSGRSDLAKIDRAPGSVHIPYGLHFLQWTSSLHDRDWHNMPLADRVIVMRRLAALERKLVTDGETHLPSSQPWRTHNQAQGFVLIIKNYGHLVGGSLAHGHQQIALSNVMPRRMRDNYHFEQERGEKFSAYLLRDNPTELLIRDYGPAVLLVPYFMRRPYDMMLIVKDTSKQYLCQLTEDEVGAVAEGWREAIHLMRIIMPDIGKDTAYNVVTHNGPGAGLYFEFLPYTQETGGFEHLGLLVCQGNPEGAAADIRRYLDQ